MTEEDDLGLDPEFSARFEGRERAPCQFYLISPLEVGGDFPDRLSAAFDGGPVAAFPFRVKAVDQHQAARLAEPLHRTCADHEVAFLVPDDMNLETGLGTDSDHTAPRYGAPRSAMSRP